MKHKRELAQFLELSFLPFNKKLTKDFIYTCLVNYEENHEGKTAMRDII